MADQDLRITRAWAAMSANWRKTLIEHSGESPEHADEIVSKMRPLFEALRVGCPFIGPTRNVAAFGAFMPMIQGQFDKIIQDVLTERLKVEIAYRKLRQNLRDSGLDDENLL